MQERSAPKKPTTFALDQGRRSEAQSFGADLSPADIWKRENAQALAASNRWVEENGLPSEKYRPF